MSNYTSYQVWAGSRKTGTQVVCEASEYGTAKEIFLRLIRTNPPESVYLVKEYQGEHQLIDSYYHTPEYIHMEEKAE